MPTHLPGHPVQDGSTIPSTTCRAVRGCDRIIPSATFSTSCARAAPRVPEVTIATSGTTLLAQTLILPAQAGGLRPKRVESCHHRPVPASVMVW